MAISNHYIDQFWTYIKSNVSGFFFYVQSLFVLRKQKFAIIIPVQYNYFMIGIDYSGTYIYSQDDD